jgi:hypothetical protein
MAMISDAVMPHCAHLVSDGWLTWLVKVMEPS